MITIHFHLGFLLLHLNLKFFKNEFNILFMQYKNQNEIRGYYSFKIFCITFIVEDTC